MRPYYAEFVKHCMKFFAKTYSRGEGIPSFKSEVDRKNWFACYLTFQRYSEADQETLLYVYGSGDTMADNIYAVSKKQNINQDKIWNLVGEFERKVAKRRGLL